MNITRDAKIHSSETPRSSSRRKLINVALKTVAGVVIPAVLLHFDPFLFGGKDGDSLAGSLSACAYVLMFLSMTAFLLRLIFSGGQVLVSGILSGAIFAGSLISGALGIVILPVSVVAVRLYGIGFLGLYPFVVSLLYFRTALSGILEVPANHGPGWRRFLCAFGGVAMTIAIPTFLLFAANAELDRLTAAARAGNDLSKVDWSRERYLTSAGDSDRIVREYMIQHIPEGQHSDLAILYRNLTGRDVEARLESLAHPD